MVAYSFSKTAPLTVTLLAVLAWFALVLATPFTSGFARAQERGEKELEKLCKEHQEKGRYCRELGDLYLEGRGVKKDLPRAAELYDRACDYHVDELACAKLVELGDLYVEGRGVEKNESRAAELYETACVAERRVPASCAKLAEIYLTGQFGRAYASRAASLYHDVCATEFRGAKEARARLKGPLYEHAKEGDTVAGWTFYLECFPQSEHAGDARRRLDTVRFNQASRQDTVAAWTEYLAHQPSAKHAAHAKRRIHELDELRFNEASSEDTIAAWTGYLAHRPSGKRAAHAKRRLDQLRREIKKDLALRFPNEVKGQYRRSDLEVHYLHFHADAAEWLYSGEDGAWDWVTKHDDGAGELEALAFLLFYPESKHRQAACQSILRSSLTIEGFRALAGAVEFDDFRNALAATESKPVWVATRTSYTRVTTGTASGTGTLTPNSPNLRPEKSHTSATVSVDLDDAKLEYFIKSSGERVVLDGGGELIGVVPGFREDAEYSTLKLTAKSVTVSQKLKGRSETIEEACLIHVDENGRIGLYRLEGK